MLAFIAFLQFGHSNILTGVIGLTVIDIMWFVVGINLIFWIGIFIWSFVLYRKTIAKNIIPIKTEIEKRV